MLGRADDAVAFHLLDQARGAVVTDAQVALHAGDRCASGFGHDRDRLVVELRVLAAFAVAGILRQAGLADDLAVAERSSQPTITNHIKRLEEAGLVERHSDPADARVSLISATSSGRAKLSAIRYEIGNFLAPRLGTLSAEDQATLRRAIDVLNEMVETDR